jgi:RimJ/RimL family protein N-acetyltransferase
VLSPSYPIETERLILRPLVAADLDAVHEIESREDVTRWLYHEPRTRPETEAWLAAQLSSTRIEREGDALQLAVAHAERGELLGYALLMFRSAGHRQGEIGYVLHPRHSGHGYATEAARELLRLGFEGLDLHRIVGRLEARNQASARVLERLGMRREAHLRENEWVKGEWQDEVIYAMLDREWRTRA